MESLLKLSLYYGNMNEILFYNQAKIKFCLLSYFQVNKVSSVILKCFKEENNRFRHRDNGVISQFASVLVEEWVLTFCKIHSVDHIILDWRYILILESILESQVTFDSPFTSLDCISSFFFQTSARICYYISIYAEKTCLAARWRQMMFFHDSSEILGWKKEKKYKVEIFYSTLGVDLNSL